MTEKRFKLSKPNGAYLIDDDKVYAHWSNDDDKIIDLLNDLVGENEQLKEELLQCKAVIDNRWSEYLQKKGDEIMTEKRYKMVNTNMVDDDGLVYYLIKKDGKDVCQVFGKHTAKAIVTELNALHEENQELHKTIEELDNCQKGQSHRINDLYLENKQLKDLITHLGYTIKYDGYRHISLELQE